LSLTPWTCPACPLDCDRLSLNSLYPRAYTVKLVPWKREPAFLRPGQRQTPGNAGVEEAGGQEKRQLLSPQQEAAAVLERNEALGPAAVTSARVERGFVRRAGRGLGAVLGFLATRSGWRPTPPAGMQCV